MAVYKCKMCGDDLPIVEGKTIVECESCGTLQTIPTFKEEGLQKSFNRANALRIKSEFDKAEQIYEKIIQADETQSDAYWGLLLCKYGIEYVEDPKTLERKPTCHRASYESIIADEDYKSALKYADEMQKAVYENQANEIDRIQKDILDLSRKEEPYDVFLCYKETDADGKRTEDAVIANEIYYELIKIGYNVFYSAITLEDKLGTAYEPYIFAALHSAKVMLVIGTKPEYFNSVWVKNEWSRYLKIIKEDRSKLLIPCYRDMDAYDLPDEFAHLQAQNMGKIGFINDLVRGIKKVVLGNEFIIQNEESKFDINSSKTFNLVKRGNIALEDGDWQNAYDFFDEALSNNPECAQAYLGQALALSKLPNIDSLVQLFKNKIYNVKSKKVESNIEENVNLIEQSIKNYTKYDFISEDKIRNKYHIDLKYDTRIYGLGALLQYEINYFEKDKFISKAFRFANGEFLNFISLKKDEIISSTRVKLKEEQENDYKKIDELKDNYKRFCLKVNDELKIEFENSLEEFYQKACEEFEQAKNIKCYKDLINKFTRIKDYKDSAEKLNECQDLLNKMEHTLMEKRKKITKLIIIPVIICICAFILIYLIFELFVLPSQTFMGHSAKVGDTLVLGSIEQDGRYSNGTEKIEWVVLDRKYGKALVISKYGLYGTAYNDSSDNLNWEMSYARYWLNDNFLHLAFNDDEINKIINTNVKDKNIKTEDKIFLLSTNEANRYLRFDDIGICLPTDQVQKNKKFESDSGKCCWWLRTPGDIYGFESYVDTNGDVNKEGKTPFDNVYAIRPVMWIDLDD